MAILDSKLSSTDTVSKRKNVTSLRAGIDVSQSWIYTGHTKWLGHRTMDHDNMTLHVLD